MFRTEILKFQNSKIQSFESSKFLWSRIPKHENIFWSLKFIKFYSFLKKVQKLQNKVQKFQNSIPKFLFRNYMLIDN